MTARSLAVLGRRGAAEGTPPSLEAPHDGPPPTRRARLGKRLHRTLVAFIAFVYVVGVAALTMLLGGVVLHSISPTHTFDIFYALHKQFVVGTLLGLAIFWLLIPHQWVGESEGALAQEPAVPAGETGGGDLSNVTALAEYRGRDPSRRPGGRGEVAG